MSTSPDWSRIAACRDQPREWWFPVKAPGQPNHGTRAISVCTTCPALEPCLEGALERNESEGIWGGAGGDRMRALRRAWVRGRTEPAVWREALEQHVAILDGAHKVIDRNGPHVTHGLRATYNRGCRCTACRWAAADDVEAKSVARRQAMAS